MKKNRSSFIIKNTLFILWAIFCLGFFIYFPGKASYVQWADLKEFPFILGKLGVINWASYIVSLLYSFLGVTIFSLACISIGMFITKVSGLETTPPTTSISILAMFATQLLLGHITTSLIFLTAAVAFRLTPLFVGITLLVGFLVGMVELKKARASLFHKENRENYIDKTIVWFSVILVFITLLQSAARLSYDATAIYFSNAKLTAMTQELHFFVNDTFVVSAFHSSIQYSAIMQLFGEQAARMYSWVCGLIIIVFSVAIGEKVVLSKHALQVQPVLLLTSTAFIDLIGDGKVDLASIAPAIASVYWLILERRTASNNRGILLLTGVFIGFASIARPFNFFLLGIFVTLFYFQNIFFENGFNLSNYKRFFYSVCWIVLGAAGLLMYHLFVNFLIFGTPLAFLSSISKIDPATGPWDYNPNAIRITRLLYPFVVTFKNNSQSLGNISPLLLAFLPLIFATGLRKRLLFSKNLIQLLVASAITLILWITLSFTVLEVRYVFFLWIIIFLPVSEVIANVLNHSSPPLVIIGRALIVTLLLFIFIRSVFISFETYAPVDQRGNPHCPDSVFCNYIKPINQTAADGERVLSLTAFRYYLRRDLFACSTTRDEYQVLQELSYRDMDAFWSEVYRQGYIYLAYEKDYTVRHLQFGMIPSPGNVPEWLYLETLYRDSSGERIAYKIHVINPSLSPGVTCKRNPQGIWSFVVLQ